MTKRWRYEPGTKTIRDVPSNHWVASMDSWDGAEDHEANARLIAAAPALADLLERARKYLNHPDVKAIAFAIPTGPLVAQIEHIQAEISGKA